MKQANGKKPSYFRQLLAALLGRTGAGSQQPDVAELTAEGFLIQWSPAQEIVEQCSGKVPRPPDRPLDLAYAEHLHQSYERWMKMSCYQDMMGSIQSWIDRIQGEWESGQVLDEKEKNLDPRQVRIAVLKDIVKIPEFSRKRLEWVRTKMNTKDFRVGVKRGS